MPLCTSNKHMHMHTMANRSDTFDAHLHDTLCTCYRATDLHAIRAILSLRPYTHTHTHTHTTSQSVTQGYPHPHSTHTHTHTPPKNNQQSQTSRAYTHTQRERDDGERGCLHGKGNEAVDRAVGHVMADVPRPVPAEKHGNTETQQNETWVVLGWYSAVAWMYGCMWMDADVLFVRACVSVYVLLLCDALVVHAMYVLRVCTCLCVCCFVLCEMRSLLRFKRIR